ncbi:inovirus Gp2 family protein [Pseudomonas marginalis]|nr:inovirus Gp2 family protein [Pseudomonas marginalis]
MTTRTIRNLLSQSDIAIRIERLVQAIQRTDSAAFKITKSASGRERVQRTRLSRYFDHIQKMVALFDDEQPYDFSEHLQVFRDACQDIGLERSPMGLTCLSDDETRYLSTEEMLNVLTDRIRHLTSKKWFKRKESDRRFQALDQQETISECVDQVLDSYRSVVVIRLDLHYSSLSQYRLRVEDVFTDLDKLSREIERNPIFDHLIWHICSVEQGEERGYHIHTAFFFDGAKVRSDVYKARQVGRLWENITCGLGYYYSCNTNKERYGDDLGIGMICQGDARIRSKVHQAMHYLAKGEDTQHLRVKPTGARCLRKGLLPKPAWKNPL